MRETEDTRGVFAVGSGLNDRDITLDKVNLGLPKIDAAKKILFKLSRFKERKETIVQRIVDNYIPDNP